MVVLPFYHFYVLVAVQYGTSTVYEQVVVLVSFLSGRMKN